MWYSIDFRTKDGLLTNIALDNLEDVEAFLNVKEINIMQIDGQKIKFLSELKVIRPKKHVGNIEFKTMDSCKQFKAQLLASEDFASVGKFCDCIEVGE